MEHQTEKRCPFTLIEKGNDRQFHEDYWGAADAFGEASEVLYDLSINEKDGKMSSLYRKQSHEYLKRARDAFITALNEETSLDASSLENESTYFRYSMNSLTNIDRKRRSIIFQRVFVSLSPSEEKNPEALQLSIEERLAALNHSISRIKPENVMKDRLKNLGVYLPDNDDKPTTHLNNVLKPAKKVSDEEQIDSLISLACEQAKFTNKVDPKLKISEEEQVNRMIAAANINETCGDKSCVSVDSNELVSEEVQVNQIVVAAKIHEKFYESFDSDEYIENSSLSKESNSSCSSTSLR